MTYSRGMDDTARRRALNEDGVVILRNFFDGTEPGDLVDAFREVFRRQMRLHDVPAADKTGSAFDRALAGLFQKSMPSYLAAAKLTQYLPALHRLGVSEPLLTALSGLGLRQPVISTRPVVHIVSEALKVPGGYHRTPPHQDWRSVQGSLDAVVAWLPLVSAAADNAPLEVIPGSHRNGLLPSEPHAFGNCVQAAAIKGETFQAIEAEPGDLVIFSMFLVHRTGAVQGDGVRWAVSFRYNNLDEPSFAARDFPNPYVYKPRDDLLVDGFPGRADLGRIFGDETNGD